MDGAAGACVSLRLMALNSARRAEALQRGDCMLRLYSGQGQRSGAARALHPHGRPSGCFSKEAQLEFGDAGEVGPVLKFNSERRAILVRSIACFVGVASCKVECFLNLRIARRSPALHSMAGAPFFP